MIAIIEKTRDRKPLSREEMWRWIESVVQEEVPDYQVSAWLMAAYLNGLTDDEIFTMTEAMATIGSPPPRHIGLVDKHSTGGVGDKTSLILAPLVAALGVPMVKMSGRGLGHTGGTLDKLESLPGFQVQLSTEQLERQVAEVGVAVIAQSHDLAPADARLYALRDVTATVDSIPLIAASVMSKKLAAKSPNIVLDVKVGSGAFMESKQRAMELARLMVRIGQAHKVRVKAILTDMNQPLGYAVGNAIEVNEAMATLKGHGPKDLTQEVKILASHMVAMAKNIAVEQAFEEVSSALENGSAWKKFVSWVTAQGADERVLARDLPLAPLRVTWELPNEKTVAAINTKDIGLAALTLGAGRHVKDQPVDHQVGIRCFIKVGQRYSAGTLAAEIYARDAHAAEEALRLVKQAVTFGPAPDNPEEPILAIVE
ncbi:MAG: thymidine phosphorylase [Sulfobacillus benefaciens]|uniref:Pyrimidine-nucleoside phosphorylase n=1 Tax=Sulfobacillus benefaciens TaxID=453960 RepID=A0A2T2XG87_9FIRM|nr:MAG: thymidine phosphorylase [Sulfobacillus benefaciens]